VRAQIIYRDRDGREIGNGVPRACWVDHPFDLIDFPLGQARCAVLALVLSDDRIVTPWKQREAVRDWMGGETVTTQSCDLPADVARELEVRLIGGRNELLLAIEFELLVADGKPIATLKR
jgi:hypothetical protein